MAKSISIWVVAAICHAQSVVTVIGGGTGGFPVGVNATSIGLSESGVSGGPVTTDSAGNVYTAAGNAVYVINTAGKASVVAGSGVSGFSDGGGIALNAQFAGITGIQVDTDGSLYIADAGNFCVWKVNAANGTIVRFAGVGIYADGGESGDESGDGGPANQAPLAGPTALALDHKGSLYISTYNGLRKVTLSTGVITTYTFIDSFLNGASTQSMAIDPTGSTLDWGGPQQVNLCMGAVTNTGIYSGSVAFDQQGNLYTLVNGDGIYKVPSGATSGARILNLINFSTTYPFLQNSNSGGIAVDASNNLYFTWGVVWKSNTSGAAPVIYAGDDSVNYNGDGPAAQATFSYVNGMAADQSGNVYLSDSSNNRVRKINLASGTVTTVAGTSVPGYNGDNQPAASAQLNNPTCLAVDSAGQNLYITDRGNSRIRQVNLTSGTITTLVSQSNGPSGFSPVCVALDGIGNLYVQENDDGVSYPVDKIPLSGGAIVSYRGAITGATLGYSIQSSIAADGAGNVYALYGKPFYTIYRLTNGTWTVFAGTGSFTTFGVEGDSGDGGPASQAELGSPEAMAFDGQGNLFLSDSDNHRIRRISLSDGVIHAVTQDPGAAGYFLLATQSPNQVSNVQPVACALADASGLAADGKGNLFLSPTTRSQNTTGGSGLIVEAADWAAAPPATVAETIGVSPSTQGFSVNANGASVNTATVLNVGVGSMITLSAPLTQIGQDGYTYTFVGWSDGNTSASRSVTAGTCPATYTALYSQPLCQTQFSLSSSGNFFYVIGPPGCSWTAQSQAPWITLATANGTGGTGPGAVAFSATGNTATTARNGAISVAGQTFTVTQAGTGGAGCSYAIEALPYTSFLPASASSGQLEVVTEVNCPWQISGPPWLQLSPQSDDVGEAVNYSAEANTSGAVRTATITLMPASGANVTYTVTQEPPNTDVALSTTSASAPANGGTGAVVVIPVDSNCAVWSAVSNVPWISITTPTSGNSGGGPVTYNVAANTGASRQGTLTIAGQTVTVMQAGGATCGFSLASQSANLPLAGGTGSFVFTASSPFCFWSAASNAGWLSLTSASLGSGSTTVTYSAAANSGGASASITIGGQTFTVTEAPAFPVTLQTNPAGLQVLLDGQPPAASTVMLSGTHMISVSTPQAGSAGTQYVFTQWSDGSTSNPRSVTVTAAASYTAVFQTQYQLTTAVSPANGGTVTPASGGYYNSGAPVNLAAMPASGYIFSNWTGSVAGASISSTTVTMSAPESVTANFVATTPITIQTSPEGLQFNLDGTAMTAPETVNLAPGSQHSLAIVTATQPGASGTEYVFQSWNNASGPTDSITVGNTAATYTASFQTQYQLTISASPANGGTVTPPSGSYYPGGTSVPISATAASGFQFSSWAGGAAGSSASTAVTMNAPETVTANFSSLTGITIQTNPPGLQFTVDGGAAMAAPQTLNLLPGAHALAVATTQTIAGATGTQYAFLSWSDAGAASHSITVGSSAATYTATFQTQYQLTILASPFAGGTVTPTSGGFYNSGASVPIAATPASGYTFSGWTGSVASSSSASTTITMSAPETVTANFASLNGITIQTTPEGLQFTVDGGAPQTAPQTLTLSQGPHTVAVTTTQAGAVGTQYTFIAWSDSGLPSHTITVGTTAATYIATFQTQYQLTISASPAADGTVTPATGTFYNAGSSVPITAIAASGFQFSNWTGSVASASSASTTVTMSAPESVTANFTAATATSGLAFYPVTPCRVADTRNANGPFGGPILSAGSSRGFAIPSSACNIPATAQAYSLNITVVPPAALGYLTAWPTGQTQPYVSTLNSSNGAIIANAAIVPAGTGGAISIYVSDSTHVIIDINGYFGGPGGSGALAFYPVTPCRVADTRNANGPFGGPSLASGATRSFTVPQSSCNIPAAAQAYSLNMTAVPQGALEYLTTWPTGQAQPIVSTLNALQGQIAANAAIVPAGANGAVSVFVSDPSNVVIDINGYFGPPGGTGALYFYPVTPCRVADTRNATGAFGGPSLGAGSTRTFLIPSSSCGLPSTALAYSFNMTVVPPGSLLYLSTWPAGQMQPVVSTLNDLQGQVIANAAIVPAGTSGGISIFVSDATNLVIDVNGYFGQ